MKYHNKAFLLYDAILALSILSAFIFFFVSFISVIQKQIYYYNIEYEAISYYRKSIFNYDANNEFLIISKDNIYSKEDKGAYCVFYKAYKENKKICYYK